MTQPDEVYRVTLQQYLERLIDERFERVESIYLAHRNEHLMQQQAIDKFEQSIDQRLNNKGIIIDELRKRIERTADIGVVDAKESGLAGRIADIRASITPGLGPRVTALEIARANLDGRFWALSAVVIILTLLFQLWPLLRIH